MFSFNDFIIGFLKALVILIFVGGVVSTIGILITYLDKGLAFKWAHILAPLAICLAPALWSGFDLDD